MNEKNRKQIVRIRILLIFVALLVVASLSAAIWLTITSYTSTSDPAETTLSEEAPSDTEATTETEVTTESEVSTEDLSPSIIEISVPETTETETETTEETTTEEPTTIESTPAPVTPSYFVWVGDSRYVGMSNHAVGGDMFICKIGVGYTYLMDHFNEVVAACQNASALILGLGVNSTGDPSAPANYGGLITNIAAQVPCPVFVQLLGSTNEQQMLNSGYPGPIYNANIDNFNQYLTNAFMNTNIRVISAEQFIRDNNLPFSDGLHYGTVGYLNIYSYLRNLVLSML